METAAVILLVTLFEVVGVIAFALWEKFMVWVVDSLFVWLKENLPKLAQVSEKLLKNAFTVLKIGAENLLSVVKESWKVIRPLIYELKLNFQKQVSEWSRIVQSKIYTLSGPEKIPTLVTRMVEEKVEYDDLPADVREAIIRGAEKNLEVDIKELRDRELLEMVN